MDVLFRSRLAKPLFFFVISMIASFAMAEPTSPTLVEMQQALMRKNPELARSMAVQRIAGADIELAKARWLPDVSVNASKGYGRGYGSYKNSGVATQKINETGSIGISITQNIYDPTIHLDIRRAELGELSSQFASEQTYEKLTGRLVSLFLDILAMQAEIDLYSEQLAAVEEQKNQAQLSFKVGTVSITDVRESEAEFDRTSAQKTALHWQMQAKQAELLTLTGLTIDPTDYKAGTTVLPNVNEDDGIRFWRESLKDQSYQLRQGIVDYQIAQIDSLKQDYRYYPKAQLVVEGNYNIEPWSDRARSYYTDNRWDWAVKLQVQADLFSTDTNEAHSVKALATEDQRYRAMVAIRENTFIELQQTYYQILAYKAEFKGLNTAVKSARTALSDNQLGYQVGMRVNAEVLNAQTKLYEVHKDRLISWYNSWRSYIKLNEIAGTLTIDQLAEIDSVLRQD